MNPREKPRRVRTCLTVYLDACAAFNGAAIIPIRQESNQPVQPVRACLGPLFNTGEFFSHIFCPKKTLNTPPSTHPTHSQYQFQFPFQALWETRRSEKARGDENLCSLWGYRVGLVRDQLFRVMSPHKPPL